MAKRSWLDRFWEKVDRSGGPDACWPWLGGYNRAKRRKWEEEGRKRPIFRLGGSNGSNPNDPQVMAYAHRLALSFDDGTNLDEHVGQECCHSCDNFRCVNARHLRWCTSEENREDRYGDSRPGTTSPRTSQESHMTDAAKTPHMTDADLRVKRVFILGLLSQMPAEDRARNVALINAHIRRKAERTSGQIGQRHGGSDHQGQNGGGGGSSSTEDLGNGLGLTSDGTIVWGQSPQSQTEIDAQNLTAVIIGAVALAIGYLAMLAYDGCGVGAAACAAGAALGNATDMSMLMTCVNLGYRHGGGGTGKEQEY